MNLRMMVAACTVATIGLSVMTPHALDQKQSFKDQSLGTWKLVSWEHNNTDGSKPDAANVSDIAGGHHTNRGDRQQGGRCAITNGNSRPR